MKKHLLLTLGLIVLVLVAIGTIFLIHVQNGQSELISEMKSQLQEAQRTIAVQQSELSSTTQQSNNRQKQNVSTTKNNTSDYGTLASAKKDCSSAATRMASALTDAQSLNSNYQSFFNPQTSSCYLRLYELEPPSFMGTRYSVNVISFRDVYSNTPIASCFIDSSEMTDNTAQTCTNSITGQRMTFDQYSELENSYIGN